MRPFKPQDRPRTRSVSLGGMHCHLWAPLHAWDTGSVAGLGHWTEQMAARSAGMAFYNWFNQACHAGKKGQKRSRLEQASRGEARSAQGEGEDSATVDATSSPYNRPAMGEFQDHEVVGALSHLHSGHGDGATSVWSGMVKPPATVPQASGAEWRSPTRAAGKPV